MSAYATKMGCSLVPAYIDLATPMGRGFMAMMSAMAEDERLRIIKRTHEGRQIARAKGVIVLAAGGARV
jgi:DNA invertase Pin-like site-specific DNA recombinase